MNKKVLIGIIAAVVAIGALVVAKVAPSNKNTEVIDKVIMHIEANELENALKVCESMNDEKLEKGEERILESILKQLNYYLNNCDNWTNTKYALVDSKSINELKIYQKILNLLPLENKFTNANTFVATALKLEKYIEWNAYYKTNDNYLTKAMEYMNQGAPYRNTSWSIAVTYYEKAYTVANNAYNQYKNSNEKGMKEAARWYKALSEEIRRVINKEDSTAAQDKEYNNASATYKKMVEEYISVLSDVIDILDTFPEKLY